MSSPGGAPRTPLKNSTGNTLSSPSTPTAARTPTNARTPRNARTPTSARTPITNLTPSKHPLPPSPASPPPPIRRIPRTIPIYVASFASTLRHERHSLTEESENDLLAHRVTRRLGTEVFARFFKVSDGVSLEKRYGTKEVERREEAPKRRKGKGRQVPDTWLEGMEERA